MYIFMKCIDIHISICWVLKTKVGLYKLKCSKETKFLNLDYKIIPTVTYSANSYQLLVMYLSLYRCYNKVVHLKEQDINSFYMIHCCQPSQVDPQQRSFCLVSLITIEEGPCWVQKQRKAWVSNQRMERCEPTL